MLHNYSHSQTSRQDPRSHQKVASWRHSSKSKADAHHPPRTNLTALIERDAPLQSHSHLVLMYGPFQTEMVPEAGQGVASWIKDCIRRHGLPSLVRFDYHRRAQIFRRDQFQPWLEPLIDQAC
ncbi:hypothetical protein [Myxacorys almedinensis]|uniref:Uncharacterized protein n=1 Tax=Myxacorys almedinensis A TaxID=2690445 RepID=A0A8J7Z082_9CYAN|nr:hypothetical protein [Myxacorys almedinensis]NDJ15728.1 hypothetical protein [Myxacorys almedinensis A]